MNEKGEVGEKEQRKEEEARIQTQKQRKRPTEPRV
jgi:hypothetical protein